MFTGIVEEMGRVAAADRRGGLLVARVAARRVIEGLERGASIAVDGCCLTAVEVDGEAFTCELTAETLARTAFAERVRVTFERYDLLLTPQMPVAAWPADPGPFEGLPDLGGKPAHSIFDRVPFMYPFNLTGQPAANLPCGFTRERLPVGLQVVGRWHKETDVFRAAAGFEALQPWAGARPPLD